MTKPLFIRHKGFQSINPDDIVYCKGEKEYVSIFLSDMSRIVVHTTMEKIASVLLPYGTVRVHRSYLINTKQIVSVSIKVNWRITTKNRYEVPVSESYKESLLEHLTVIQ